MHGSTESAGATNPIPHHLQSTFQLYAPMSPVEYKALKRAVRQVLPHHEEIGANAAFTLAQLFIPLTLVNWHELRPIIIADFERAAFECHGPADCFHFRRQIAHIWGIHK